LCLFMKGALNTPVTTAMSLRTDAVPRLLSYSALLSFGPRS
jgi:hypothetical protein